MKKELGKLWHSYLIETIVERNDKEKEIIKQLTEKDNHLREMLNEEQIAALEEYDNAFLKVSNISDNTGDGSLFAMLFALYNSLSPSIC